MGFEQLRKLVLVLFNMSALGGAETSEALMKSMKFWLPVSHDSV